MNPRGGLAGDDCGRAGAGGDFYTMSISVEQTRSEIDQIEQCGGLSFEVKGR